MFDKAKAKIETATKTIEAGIFDSVWGLTCAIILAGIMVSIGLLVIAAAL